MCALAGLSLDGLFTLYAFNDDPSFFDRTHIVMKRCENTSSTILELQVQLWPLNEVQLLIGTHTLLLSTQTHKNIIGLPARRDRLEKNNYLPVITVA